MIRHLLLAVALLGAGALVLRGEGTLAGFTDPQAAGVNITAEVVQDGSHDPWFAYEDTNNDNRYTEGVDIAIPDEEILDGSYEVTNNRHGLVVPKSVGPIETTTGAIHLEAGQQGHLVVEVRLSAATELSLVAGSDAILSDLIAEAPNGISVQAGGTLDVQGAYLRAPAGPVTLAGDQALKGLRLTLEAAMGLELGSKQGPVQVARGSLATQGPLTVEAGGSITAEHASLVAGGDILLDARGDIYVKASTLETPGDLELTAGNPKDTLFVEGARFRDANGVAKAGPKNVAIVGTPAEGTIDEQG